MHKSNGKEIKKKVVSFTINAADLVEKNKYEWLFTFLWHQEFPSK